MNAASWQHIAVGLCVTAASSYLALLVLRWLRSMSADGGCHGCHSRTSRPCQIKPLVTIETGKATARRSQGGLTERSS